MAEASPGARIGRTLRALREERLLSRPVLAERAGVNFMTIDHIERGLVERPRRTTLEKLAGPLGVGVNELIDPARPLAQTRPEVQALELTAMFEAGPADRQRALEAATPDEIERYLAEVEEHKESSEAEIVKTAVEANRARDELHGGYQQSLQ